MTNQRETQMIDAFVDGELDLAGHLEIEERIRLGPATAQKILAYRQQHGSFKSVEELLQVSGIGPKKLAAMRASVRV